MHLPAIRYGKLGPDKFSDVNMFDDPANPKRVTPYNWEFCKLDVSSRFLNSQMDYDRFGDNIVLQPNPQVRPRVLSITLFFRPLFFVFSAFLIAYVCLY